MTGRSLTNKDFFGRAKQSQVLRERAKALVAGFRQNIAVLGKPLIGKTSIIQDFIPDLYAEQIIPIYVQARQEPFELFAQRFIGSLLYQYLKLKGHRPEKDELNILIKNCRKTLAKTTDAVDKIMHLADKKDFDGAYDTLLDLPRLAQGDSDYLCAVIIEDFDKLAGYKLQNPYSVLGKKIMAQRNTFYIVTSSSVEAAKQILSEKLQLLFGNFEIMELEEFDFSTSRDFLTSRLESFSINDNHLRFIVSFTDGHPYYLDVISSALKKSLKEHKKRQITSRLLGEALNDTLFNPQGQLNQHFSNIIYRYCRNKNGADGLSILVSLSNGNCKFRHLTDSFNYSLKSLTGAVSDLQAAGLIRRVGAFNRVEDPLLRFWLKTVYDKRRMDFTHDASSGQRLFTASIQKISVDFAKSCKEDLYGKIVGLFKEFRDDFVQLGQKRHKLPSFGDVGIRVIGQNGPYIIGHAKGVNWICQIHERGVSEKQVSDFLKDSRCGKYKFHRKVLIVLNGMDDNAKLLAKESDIWVWNLKTLNLLLDLYGKHKVVIC